MRNIMRNARKLDAVWLSILKIKLIDQDLSEHFLKKSVRKPLKL